MANDFDVSVQDVSGEMKAGADLKFLDVREPHELEISRLSEVVAIPLGDLPSRWEELDPAADWVVICRSGMRSAQATQFLLGRGFAKVRNMAGGMNAWASEIDPSLSTY